MQHNEEMNLLNVLVLKRSYQTALHALHVDVINTSSRMLCNKNKHTLHQRHPTLYSHSYGLPTAVILVWLTITSGAYWNSWCIASALVTLITSRRIWLKSGRCLIRRSSTGPSSSGVHVFWYAFENKEDIVNISCSLNLLD